MVTDAQKFMRKQLRRLATFGLDKKILIDRSGIAYNTITGAIEGDTVDMRKSTRESIINTVDAIVEEQREKDKS